MESEGTPILLYRRIIIYIHTRNQFHRTDLRQAGILTIYHCPKLLIYEAQNQGIVIWLGGNCTFEDMLFRFACLCMRLD